jgi:hypothetical protein
MTRMGAAAEAVAFISPAPPAGAGNADDGDTAPQLPLCRRPAVHVDELSAALAWRAEMAGRISQLGDTLERQDGGPDMAGLLVWRAC